MNHDGERKKLQESLHEELEEIERVGNESIEKKKCALIVKFNKALTRLEKMWKKLDKQEEIIKTKATLYKLNHESSELDEQITELSSSCT
jgi:uncharacterized protein YifE (UPF0438 family)